MEKDEVLMSYMSHPSILAGLKAILGEEGWKLMGPWGQHLLAYLLPVVMFVCSETCCRLTSYTVTELMIVWTGKRPPKGTPPGTKELRALEWKGDGSAPTNEYLKQKIKGSTSERTKMPNHVVVRVGEAIVRLDPPPRLY